MQSLRTYLPLVALFLALLAAGCEGAEGPIGPDGPPGSEGPGGAEGPQGPAGSANVTVETFTFAADDLDSTGARRTLTREIAAIDTAVVDSGNVMAFVEQFGEGNVANATVSIEAQNSDDGQTITIAEAYVPNDGYIAIHDTSLLSGSVLGSVIGVSDYLEPGVYEDLQVTLFDVPGTTFPADTALGGAQDLIAMPHMETDGNEEYNFITSEGAEDGPYTSGGSAIVAAARTTVGPNAKVTFEAQESNGQSVMVSEVYFPRDGYIAIHDSTLLDDPPQVAGSVIGVSNYFEAGLYADVEVALFDVPGADFAEDSTLAGDQQLIAMPHEETSGNMVYNFITSEGAEDGPYFNTDEDEGSGAVVSPAEITLAADGGEGAARAFAQRDAPLPAGFVASEPTPVTNVNGNPDSFWAALPYTIYADDGAGGTSEVDLRFSYNYGEFALDFASAQASALDNLGGEYSVKVVVIPPDEEDGGGAEASALTRDFETYEQAARALGLPLTDGARR